MADDEFSRKIRKFFYLQGDLTSARSGGWAEEEALVDLARTYVRYYWKGGSFELARASMPGKSDANVSVAISGQDLGALTRRIHVLNDVSMLTHFEEAPNLLSFVDHGAPRAGAPGSGDDVYVRCNNLLELGTWLRDCQPLLETGDVRYFPDIVSQETSSYADGFREGPPEVKELSVGDLANVIVDHGQVIDWNHGAVKKSRLVYPLLSVDLPFIDDIDMRTFSSMSLDFRDELHRARDSLRADFLALEGALGEEKLETAVQKLSLKIKKSVDEVDQTYRESRRASSFLMANTLLGSTSAVLALATTFTPAAAAVGATTGLVALAKVLEKHLDQKQKLKSRDLYFFWMLKSKAGRS